MRIIEVKDADVLTLGLNGRLDAATSKTVEDRLLQVIEAGERRLVLDLANMDYISSVGLRVLILASKRLKQVQGKIVVCSLQESIRQVFEIAGFVSLFTVYETREQAVHGFK